MNVLPLNDIADRNLGRILYLQSQAIPEKNCLLVDDKAYTFKVVNEQVNRYAHGLSSKGVKKGDRVAIFLPSCEDYIFLAHAANKLGAVWVPVNGDYKGEWLSETINDSRPVVLITDESYLPKLNEVIDSITCKQLVVRSQSEELLPHGASLLSDFNNNSIVEPAAIDIDYGDTSAILWTSGTTGKSKGVMVPHNVWIRSGINIHAMFGTLEDDVAYNCLPLYNTASWVTNVYRALIAGIPLALDPIFSASQFWDRIRHYKATETITLGAMHMFLWKQPEMNNDADNTLRAAHVIPLPEEIVEPFRKRFGISIIERGYGQSEANPIMYRVDDGSKAWAPNALGNVMSGIELKLLDDDGEEVPLGTAGEFCIDALEPYVLFNGYFENPTASENAYFGKWYRTGDLGMKDAEGNFYFVDRKNDFLRYKGRNISSLQVEAMILRHPAVNAVACFGIQSEELESESEIKVNVICNEGQRITAEDLARFVNDNAPYFFVPRYIEFVESLPYTPTNKVQKYKLRELGLVGDVWDRMKTDFILEK